LIRADLAALDEHVRRLRGRRQFLLCVAIDDERNERLAIDVVLHARARALDTRDLNRAALDEHTGIAVSGNFRAIAALRRCCRRARDRQQRDNGSAQRSDESRVL
jgi:hypothetical protein